VVRKIRLCNCVVEKKQDRGEGKWHARCRRESSIVGSWIKAYRERKGSKSGYPWQIGTTSWDIPEDHTEITLDSTYCASRDKREPGNQEKHSNQKVWSK
jgi:hypothetical protein